ncbi:hypothetical protein B7P43_G09803 [Cryptotermes secundus]|uniref:Uncharacterized protein n=1 Tax=Cryptotermes secundus TaxID=105785 RepID=A0A2J7PS44_9NEOP|nr:hypothetical protein B7P43_G09803 [Cryptotermes secundus]
MILPVVLYGCETRSLTLREEHRLRVLRIFGPERDEVTGGLQWKKLHNEELHNWYSSPSIIGMIKSRRVRWAERVARMGEKRNVYRILVGKPESKGPQGRFERRWKDNTKTDLREGIDWIHLTQDRHWWRTVLNKVVNFWVP